MKKLTTLLFLLVFATSAIAQKATLKGTIVDTFSKQNLSHAVISVLRSKDSVLYKFTRSKENGAFILPDLNNGKYVLLVSYPSYADYYDTLTLQDNNTFDLGNVMLTTKAHLLSDVTVVQKIASIRMKGDTIVYKADSFHVKEGASVEELLKRFPGIQVDKNGKITAQGTKVEKVLVDGEEFFGDDPTIATKGLNAKMVNEVQVFDKKSDQAVFTGIDDGQTTRTINLKLKDDAKKGWFGKVDVGAGLNDIWNNSLMANSFKQKRKFSVYGIASSTGKVGLNWDERGKFGDASSNDLFSNDDDGEEDENLDYSSYWGEGIPKSWSGGINYGNKYHHEKQSLNGSYRYVKLINNGGGNTVSQSILPDTLFFNNERRNVYGNKDKHSVNGSFDWMIDSSFSLKLSIVGSKGSINGYSNYYGNALNAYSKFVNKSTRNISSVGDNQSLKTTLLLKKRFKKPGRTLSLNIGEALFDTNTDGFLYAVNDYFDKTETIFKTDTTDQKKINGNNSNIFSSKLAYTEQFSKTITVEMGYSLMINKYENKILSYDKSQPGKYDQLNTVYSNDYDFNITTNKVGSTLRYNKKKVNISLGGDVAFANFKQTDLIKQTVLDYSYTNLFPRAGFVYKFNANKRFNLNYYGNTKQATIQQIQPVADNTNPLFIQIGNASLKQEFNHGFNANFNNYQVLKNRGYRLSMNYNFTDQAIRSNQKTDSVGKTINQYININGNNSYSINGGYNFKLEKLQSDIYFNYSFRRNNNVNFINNLKNITKTDVHEINIDFSKEKEKVYSFWAWAGINYNMSQSSIRPEINTNYWSTNLNFSLNIELPWKLELDNEIKAEIRQKTQLFSGNNSATVWNSYIAKKILKTDKAQIRFSAFDILNQNRGYRRSINSTTLTENTYQQLAQYFLLSFVWNFSKGGLQK